MTMLQAAILSSRLICAWLIYNAAMGTFALMRNAVMTMGMMGEFANSRIMRQNIDNSIIFFIQVVLNVALAVFLFRCGPKVLGFLMGPEKEVPAEAEE